MKRKNKLYWTILLALGQLLYMVNVVHAVNAYPEPITYTQPDGSKITILLKGDEFIHLAVTSDGYTIMTNSAGTYEYAVRDNSGRLIFSGVQANDPGRRSTVEKSLLAKTTKGLFFSKAQVKDIRTQLEQVKAPQTPLMGGFPSGGTRKLLMILANYSNTSITFPQANFNNYMNQPNYNGTGSFKDYFIEVSYGQLVVNTTVTVWVTVPNIHDYYGPQSLWGEFAYQAVVAANNQAGVNFAEYDNDQNGTVDGIAIIHQGQGQEESGNINDIWSHSWDLTSAGYSYAQRTFDGVQVDAYTTMPEKNATGMGTIGVMCHEFCHNLGAPDFYDTDYNTNGSYSGTGKWDVMGGGSWNGLSGTKPAHPNPWIKAYFGWTTPVVISTVQNVTLRNAQAFPDVVRFNTTTANEYFLCENRQQTGFDAGIPGHGLIIYHVDGSYISTHTVTNNINTSAHQGLYPVCANATGNPSAVYGTINSTGCPFPGSGFKTSFTDLTTPNSHSWAGVNSNCPVTNIFEYMPAEQVTFCFVSCFTPDDPTAFAAITSSLSQVNLSWGLNTGSNPVLVAFSTTPNFGTPVAGTNYTAGNQIVGGGTVLYTGTETNISHTALNPSTTYYYKAWSVLSGTTYSPGVNANATTYCGVVSVFPWNEGFENGGMIPGCWSQEWVNNSGLDWLFIPGNNGTNPGSAHTGSYNACLKDKTAPENKSRLISPVLNLSSVTNPQLTFWHTQPKWGSDQDQLIVYYRNSVNGAWIQLTSYCYNIASWTMETISLPNKSSAYSIAFEGNAKFGYGICIDDVQVGAGCSNYTPVSISIQTSMNPVCAGMLVKDTAITAFGGTSPSFQWKVAGSAVPGATNSTYSHAPNSNEAITCMVVSNANCVTGNPATSNVLNLITYIPLEVGSITGNQATCSGSVPSALAGLPPLNGTSPVYQWQSSPDNVTFTDIPGATSLNYQPGILTSTMYYRQLQSAFGTCGGPGITDTVTVAVNQVLPVSVSVAASANPSAIGNPVTFTANAINGGSMPSYLWKINGIDMEGATDATYSYIPENGDEISCGIISSESCVAGNTAFSNPVYLSVIYVQTVTLVENLSITGFQCFDAIETITVAGNNTNFVVENSGTATMIAGHNIRYLPGTTVQPGGYLHGYITTTGEFCASQVPANLISSAGEAFPRPGKQLLFNVFPNPTPGTFALEIGGTENKESTMVEIYSMKGERMLSEDIKTDRKHEFSLSGKPTGIYLMRVVNGKNTGTLRIVKE